MTNLYDADLNTANLRTQLEKLKFNLPAGISGIKDVKKYVRNLTQVQIDLLSDICIVIKFPLMMPATNSVSEISFSTLSPIKTYLRSVMTQGRLNYLIVFHIHKDLTDKLNLTDVGNEFVGQSEHRLVLFGSFPEKGR